MVTSVDSYLGFYIGRYEITANGEKPGDSLTNENWYSFYNKCMEFDDEYVTSGMIYGTLWDATMQWLSSKYDVGYTGNTTNGYGNFYYETITVGTEDTIIIIQSGRGGKKLQTGQISYTKSNNIYDLSGNCYDWTQELKDYDYRVLRGGNYYTTSSDYSYADSRYTNSSPIATNAYYSTRSHLYIK